MALFQMSAEKEKASGSSARSIAAGDAARDRRDWAEAAVAYQRALKQQPDLAGIWVQYGNMLKEQQKFKEAEAAYLEAIRLVPDDPDVHLQYGHLLKLDKRPEEAAASYHRSVMLDPTQTAARAELSALAALGVARAKVQLPKPDSIPQSSPLNAKLIGARQQLAELRAEVARRLGGRNGHGAAENDATQALDAAYDSITALLRNFNQIGSLSPQGEQKNANVRAVQIRVVFDISDLIQYFRHHRLPTGIQRVQIEAIRVALLKEDPNFDIHVCCFTESHDYWREVPAADFITIAELSLIGNDPLAPDWRGAMDRLEGTLAASPNFSFPRGAFLVNIGTSWWLQNYFLYVRSAKQRDEIKYVPFVHDMIPIMTPEHCVEGLTQDFISWVLGVFVHADFFMVNSEATRKDLHAVAARLGYDVPDSDVHTVRLDADFRKDFKPEVDPAVLQTHRLTRGGFVLFVSTIESRKNHLAAFNAWTRLMKQYGPERMPKLVCVGIRGWLNDPVFAKLGASSDLRHKVAMLSGITDKDLAILYQSCLFTLYPSSYEGWGLPVTESLCYGKLPVVADASSLPEAGGEFAEYFRLGDENHLTEVLERVIFQPQHRLHREALIREKFRPRRWEEISDDIIGTLGVWSERDSSSPLDRGGHAFPPAVKLGRYYQLSRNTLTRIYKGMVSGEMFRDGDGWWGCDDWGCWTKPSPARLLMRVSAGAGTYRFYLGLQGLPDQDTPYDVTVLGCDTVRGMVRKQRTKWLSFDLTYEESLPTVNVVLQGYTTSNQKARADEPLRPVAVGVVGFMLCRADDAASRSNFVEAVALDTLAELANAR